MVMEAPSIERALRLRARRAVDNLDMLREMRALARSRSQVELARGLRITQPSVNSALKTAEKVPDVRPGFSGATPYEIAQRYSAGLLARAELIDELARWEYESVEFTDGPLDWNAGAVTEGTWEEVARALDDGLLEPEVYDAIIDRQGELGQ
jgi:hypothetical protein